MRPLQLLVWRAEEDLDLLADLELVANNALLVYASHLVEGRVDVATVERRRHATPSEVVVARLLQDAVASDRIGEALAALSPRPPGYGALQDALLRYRDIAATGGWAVLPEEPLLEAGASGEPVRLL